MAKCNQLTPLPFKGLNKGLQHAERRLLLLYALYVIGLSGKFHYENIAR